ncbi:MAG: DUF1844 domain-containing protein [Acidobacteria bacterium]|nr:DUF1844 domain-containing protein [Acidobacteriota bacterium]
MIGKDTHESEEEPVLKVTDKRKFNVDGSLRDGVTIEKEETKAESAPVIPDQQSFAGTPESGSQIDLSAAPSIDTDAETPQTLSEEEEEALLDDQNPASFINFLSTLVTNAAASLGAMPHPVTGQKSVDLDTGKYWIDVLAMLREKTDGNLLSQEKALLESILGDLRMQFVALTRASEEKLKAQAAKKFSSKDILGG